MRDIDILKGIRCLDREIALMLRQLDKAISDGAPCGYTGSGLERLGTGTNHREAARQQHVDYLEALLKEKQDEQQRMIERFETLLAEILDSRLRVILRAYYVLGMTDEAIGEEINMSTRRVNALRNAYVRSLDGQDAA